MERLLAKADDYLRMRETQFEGVPVESLVRFGRPAPEILVEAETFGADLITMTRPEGRWLKRDRKSTRPNSSHSQISYAVFCLKKKTMALNAAALRHNALQHPARQPTTAR